MAWEFEDITGQSHSVGGNELQALVDQGLVVKETVLWSTNSGKSARADRVLGLRFPEGSSSYEESQALDFCNIPASPAWEYKPRKSEPVARVGFLDLEFRGAITPTFVSLLWATWLVVGFAAIALVAVGLSVRVRSMGASWAQLVGIVVCILVGYVFATMVVRIVLECTVVLFRIADYLKRMAK
jgi:hypothetical protein